MRIKSLSVKNFRNFHEEFLEFDKGLNILFGDNAQGKTNILEAIFVAATTKSHKGSKDREMIKMDEKDAHITLFLEKEKNERKIDIHLNRSKTKNMAIDGIVVKRAIDIFGLANVVFFSPEDLNMVKNGPAERRRFVDMELSQLDRIYLYKLSNYDKVISQRNNLLKQILEQENYSDMLDIWDEQLLKFGIDIIKSREQFIADLNEIIKPIHFKLTGEKEELILTYDPNVTAEDFAEKLKKSRNNDIYQKVSLTGPHKDDIIFTINGQNVRKFGSQGQQRSTALSLKLAEIELFKRVTGDNPILLLDDVLSELDRNRQNYLINGIGDIQTIITCTGLEEFVENKKDSGKIYNISEGRAKAYL